MVVNKLLTGMTDVINYETAPLSVRLRFLSEHLELLQ